MLLKSKTLVEHTLSDKISSDKIFDGQNMYFIGQNFRHQAEISTVLSDFCLNFVLKHWTKSSTDKTFDTKLKFRHFCPTNFCPIRYVTFEQIFLTFCKKHLPLRKEIFHISLTCFFYPDPPFLYAKKSFILA